MNMKNFGAFYYSQNRQKLKERLGENHCNYFTPLFSKKSILYNEWVSKFPFISTAKWKDQRFLGFGFYDHAESK